LAVGSNGAEPGLEGSITFGGGGSPWRSLGGSNGYGGSSSSALRGGGSGLGPVSPSRPPLRPPSTLPAVRSWLTGQSPQIGGCDVLNLCRGMRFV
jgi:hypothetical protein